VAGDASRFSPINTRGIERYLRRVLNTVGPVVPDHIRGDVTPSIEVRPVFAEDFAEFGIVPWGGALLVPAVAGRVSHLVIASDILTGFDVVITDIEVTPGAGSISLQRGARATWSVTAGTGITPRDTRYANSAFGSVIMWNGSELAVLGNPLIQIQGAVTDWHDPVRGLAIIRANTDAAVALVCNTANTAFTASLRGYALPADAGLA
jgi:hypothetical protein